MDVHQTNVDRIGDDKRGGHVHKSAPVLAPGTTDHATRISARLHAVEGERSRRQGWRRLARGVDRGGEDARTTTLEQEVGLA